MLYKCEARGGNTRKSMKLSCATVEHYAALQQAAKKQAQAKAELMVGKSKKHLARMPTQYQIWSN